MEREARVRRADGEYCWWFVRNVPLRDETGKLVRWYGTAIDIEDRKRAEQALRKSEERWRSVFENSAIGVAVTDLNGRFLATNHVYQTIVGYTEEELRDLAFLDVTHEDYREGNWELITELLEGKRRQFQIEKKYRRKDGSSIWVSNNVSLVRGAEAVPRFIMALSEDITQCKRAEEALRSHQQNLRLLVDTIPGHVVTTTPTGEIELLNRRVLEYFDKTPEELVNWRTSDAIHPDDLALTIAAWNRAVQTGEPYEREHRLRRADGAYRWFHTRGLALRDKEGRIVRWYLLPIDVDDRRRAEEALQRSEGYLAEAQKLTQTGSWAAQVSLKENVNWPENVNWSNVYWSKEMYRIFGFDPDLGPPSSVEVVRRLHPEDALSHPRMIERAIRDGADFELDYRLLLPDGTAKHIHAVGHPVVNASGDVTEVVGTAMDVTERKRAEDALRASEASLLEATRLTRTCSWKHDILSGKVTVSAEGLVMFGIKPEDDASSVDFFLKRHHPEDRPEVEQAYAAGLLRKTDFEADFRLVLPDGTIKNTRSLGHSGLHARGNVVEFVGASIDITEHHRARADLEKALEEIKRLKDQLHDENVVLREQIDQAFMFEEIIGTSSALQGGLSRLMKVAPTDSSVLVIGETGTGKELVARAIHKRSRRSQRAFVSVNCAALAPSLISSELFGHEKGAFTGALQRRLGRFELANGGTIFLDEIGELPLDTQVALLRVLQEREFERVGGTQPVKIDVRVIAATNRDLEAAVANGTFRPDLYYRLNVFPIQTPPLRERQDDLLMLLEYFVQRFAQKMGKHFKKIDKRTVELFRSYPWPGNIRELQNVVERSVIVSPDGVFSVDAAWLSKDSRRVRLQQQTESADANQDASRDRQIIEDALVGSRGRVAGPNGAAARLRVSPSTLEYRIK